MSVYLDHNATTPVHPDAADAVAEALRSQFGNASSVHAYGQAAKAALDDARGSVAALVGGEPSEIVFTSGGTEADNLAIRGVAEAAPADRRHLIASAIEHEAVLHTFKALAARGWRTTLLPVGSGGVVDPAELERALTPETALVSVMHANNEIGTLQPIADLAAHRARQRESRPRRRRAVGREGAARRARARGRSAVRSRATSSTGRREPGPSGCAAARASRRP